MSITDGNHPVFSTVDELIESQLNSDNSGFIRLVIDNIIIENTQDLLTVMQSKTNKPSKYDLLIIESVNGLKNVGGDFTLYHNHTFYTILEIYKNRK